MRVAVVALAAGIAVTLGLAAGRLSGAAEPRPRIPAGSIASAVALAPDRPVDFASEVLPILASKCFRCHGGVREMAGLNLAEHARLTSPLRSGRTAVVAGDPAASEMVSRVRSSDANERMPPEGSPLSEHEIRVVERWVAEGARWGTHWAFRARKEPPAPVVAHASWIARPLDRFVLARLEQAGLAPAPRADRATLARRAALDLTGIPPRRRAPHRVPLRSCGGRCRLRALRRRAARESGIWRALRARLDGPRPLRRHPGLREGQPSRDLGVARLGDRCVERRHALRRLRGAHAGGRHAGRGGQGRRVRRRPPRDGVPPEHAHEHRGRHRQRGVPHGRRVRPRVDHVAVVPRRHVPVRAVPRASLRPDLAPRVLRFPRVSEPDRGRGPRRRRAPARARARGREDKRSRDARARRRVAPQDARAGARRAVEPAGGSRARRTSRTRDGRRRARRPPRHGAVGVARRQSAVRARGREPGVGTALRAWNRRDQRGLRRDGLGREQPGLARSSRRRAGRARFLDEGAAARDRPQRDLSPVVGGVGRGAGARPRQQALVAGAARPARGRADPRCGARGKRAPFPQDGRAPP